ncbi:MAG TPA: LamG domain-containing protein [Puia sp.]|nr:LamG domain-containing protein [Puia sp.]
MLCRNKLASSVLLAAVFSGLVMSCQKTVKPALPKDYPTDNVTLPSGPLRFYLPFDSTSTDANQINIRFADSISGYPSFFPDASVKFTDGVRGTAYQGAYDHYIHYYNANDFAQASDFTIAFWFRATLAQKDHTNADGVLALSSTVSFWSNFVVYVDHETSTSDSLIFKIHFQNGPNDNWDFASYDGNKRLPHGYDGNWHHIAFTYDAGAQTGKLYYDGALYDTKTNEVIKFDGNANQLVVGGFQEAIGIVDTYANNSWMSGWPGDLDNIRLYNAALTDADVQGLYTNKQ